MLRTHYRSFNYFQRLADLLILLLTWVAMYFLRFSVFEGEVGQEQNFLRAAAVLLLVSIFFFSHEGLYRSYRLSSRQQEILAIFKANAMSIVAFIVVLYFVTDKRLSRAVIIGYFTFSTVLLVIFRMSVRQFLRNLRGQGKNLRSILLVGHGGIIEEFVKAISTNKDAGIRFMGWVDSRGAARKFQIPEAESVEQVRTDGSIDQIVVSYVGEDAALVHKVVEKNFNDTTPLVVLPDLTQSYVGSHVEYVAGLPALTVNQPYFSETDLFLKRAFDFSVTFLGLLLISPLLIVLSILVKVTSPGPIFFGQERIGLDGKRFKMWKFRSMRADAEKLSTWTTKDDPRRTVFGTFLRKTSLDELPQLWNVLVGDMSLVGPRPEQPHFVDKFRHEIPAYMLRHKMKAGITGWAQVNGWRGDTSLHERIICDLYYIKNYSFWLDVKILFLTFWNGFINKNAY